MEHERRNRTIMMMAMPALLVAIAVAVMFAYRAYVVRSLKTRAYQELSVSAGEQAELVRSQIDAGLKDLRAVAALMELADSRDRAAAQLQAAASAGRFDGMALLDGSGAGVTVGGEELKNAGKGAFRRAAAGEQVFDFTSGSFIFAVPVSGGAWNGGALLAAMTPERFRALMGVDAADERYSFLCDGDGDIVLGSSNSAYLAGSGNVLETLGEGSIDENRTLAGLAADLKEGKSGSIAYTLVGRQRYAVYEPLGLNGWMLFRVLSVAQIDAVRDALTARGDMMVLAVLLSALCVLAGEYLFNERNIQRLEADREQIRLSDERFRIALENGRLSIWDYDFATHSIIQPEHALMLHGSDRVILNVPQSLVAGGIVHPDSVHDFLEMYEHLRAGASPVEGVFRIRRSEQGYWYQHIRYTTLTDKHGRPYRAIGMAEDVTERYETARRYRTELQQLSDLAQRDPLTGLLNRSAAEKMIAARLESAGEEELCALYIIDLDGFKRVNDLLGHQRGDQTLTEIARVIRGVFRATDVAGRLGGDEFFVFLTTSGAPGLIEARAAELCAALQFAYPYPEGQVQVSGSVGVASCVGGSYSFRELYAAADAALYRAKHEGKARFVRTSLGGETEVSAPAEPVVPAEPASGIPMQTLLEHIEGGVLLCEMAEEPRILYASPSFFHFSGRSRESLGPLGERIFSVVWPDDLPQLMEKLRAGAAQGRVVDCAYRVTEADGRTGWRHLRAVRIPYEQAAHPVLLGVVTDITELIHGREELRAANERLNFAFLESGLLLWEYDLANDRIRFWEENEGRAEKRVNALLREALTHRERDPAVAGFFAGLAAAARREAEITVQDGGRAVRCFLRCRVLPGVGGAPGNALGVAGEKGENHGAEHSC